MGVYTQPIYSDAQHYQENQGKEWWPVHEKIIWLLSAINTGTERKGQEGSGFSIYPADGEEQAWLSGTHSCEAVAKPPVEQMLPHEGD